MRDFHNGPPFGTAPTNDGMRDSHNGPPVVTAPTNGGLRPANGALNVKAFTNHEPRITSH